MFVSAIKKAHDTVEDIAVDAAIGLTTLLLGCGAYIFAAIGAAWWLSTMMPVYFALFIIAGATAVIAVTIYIIGLSSSAATSSTAPEPEPVSPLANLSKLMGSTGAPLDLVATGLFTRQMKRAPISTIAATAAVGALIGMITSEADEE